MRFGQTSRPRLERAPRTAALGLAPGGTASSVRPDGVLGAAPAASSPPGSLPRPAESDEALLMPADADGGCGCLCSTWPRQHPAAEPRAAAPHGPWYTEGGLSTEFNSTAVPGMGEPDPGETLLRQPAKSGRYIAGSLVPLLWETRPERYNGACWLENL